MDLLILCLCSTAHRTSNDEAYVEISLQLAKKLNKLGWLELSDYFVNYESYGLAIDEAIQKKQVDRWPDVYLLLDGVGGKVDSKNQPPFGKEHREAGTFLPDRLDKPHDKRRRVRLLGMKPGKDAEFALLTGHGWNRNVSYTMTLLNQVWGVSQARSRSPKIDTVQQSYLSDTTKKQVPIVIEAVENLQKFLGLRNRGKRSGFVEQNVPVIRRFVIGGFSRGGITALKIARALHGDGIETFTGMDLGRDFPLYKDFKVFSDVPVYLFGVDPVAGGASQLTMSNLIIPPNVAKAVCPISMQEDKNIINFTPLNLEIVNMQSSGDVLFLPFPGNHIRVGTMPRKDAKDTSDYIRCSAVPRIIFSMYSHFLRKHHERLGSISPKALEHEYAKLSRHELLEMYAEIILQKRHYLGYDKSVAGKVTSFWKLDKLVPNAMPYHHQHIVDPKATWQTKPSYVKAPYYFVNEHHRGIFKSTFPATYDFILHPSNYYDPKKKSIFDVLSDVWAKDTKMVALSVAAQMKISASIMKVFFYYPDMLDEATGGILTNALADGSTGQKAQKCRKNGTYKDFASDIGPDQPAYTTTAVMTF